MVKFNESSEQGLQLGYGQLQWDQWTRLTIGLWPTSMSPVNKAYNKVMVNCNETSEKGLQ